MLKTIKQKLTRIHQLIQVKIQKTREYYKTYGLWQYILLFFERRGVIFKRVSIFFEINLENFPPYNANINTVSLDFVQVNKKDFETLEFPDDSKWITKNIALRWLNERNCAFFALKDKNKIICYQLIEFKKANISLFELSETIPDKTVYSFALYTVPEYRGRGVALQLKLFVLQYLKEHGYQRAFLVIAPDNAASQTVNKKVGCKEYQIVIYRRLLFLKYYCVKDHDTLRKKRIWCFEKTELGLWNTFSKIEND